MFCINVLVWAFWNLHFCGRCNTFVYNYRGVVSGFDVRSLSTVDWLEAICSPSSQNRAERDENSHNRRVWNFALAAGCCCRIMSVSHSLLSRLLLRGGHGTTDSRTRSLCFVLPATDGASLCARACVLRLPSTPWKKERTEDLKRGVVNWMLHRGQDDDIKPHFPPRFRTQPRSHGIRYTIGTSGSTAVQQHQRLALLAL